MTPHHYLVALVALLGLSSFETAAQSEATPGADLFTNGPVLRIRIRMTPEDMSRLRNDSRQDVPVTVQEGESVYQRVGVHLKGSTGSFRNLDDKPALTLNFNKFVRGQRFHGLRKIHLNNSVEDPSYFNELAGFELFRNAGVPAPRVAHALVELNGRRLGLYVLKEGFAEEFLKSHFRKTNGNLYDTGPGWDVDEALEKDQGDGPDDRSDLAALVAAAREPDPAQRWQRLSKLIHMEQFITFMAMEVLVCHRDGYCLGRNNFRIYQDPASDRWYFLPHGMDQLFGRPEATIRPVMSGLVARAVMDTPEGRQQYRERLAVLTTNVLDVPAVQSQADAFLNRVRSVLEPGEARALAEALAEVKERIRERHRCLEQQLRESEPSLLSFGNGVARLAGWKPVDAPAGGRLDESAAPDGRKSLHLRAGRVTSASWRTTVLLAKGQYRFQALVRTQGVEALNFGRNHGAGLRVVGGGPMPPYEFVGDHDWTRLEQPFEIQADQQVELICELRARAGDAWFDLESLRLVNGPEPK
jgi:hypothetical protein